ncbi:MAG: GNAT family N-acetyltransferase [Solirubrobacteraceae bacterium]
MSHPDARLAISAAQTTQRGRTAGPLTSPPHGPCPATVPSATILPPRKASAPVRAKLSKARRLGLSGFLVYATRRAFRAVVFRKDVLLVFSRSREDGVTRESPGPQPDLRWSDSRLPRDCGEQQPDYFTPRRIDAYERRLAQGDRCWALVENEALLTLGWVGVRSAIEAAPEVGPRFSVAVGERVPVIYDCWTAPEFRRRGFYSQGLDAVARALFVDHERVWIYCLESNQASARGIQRARFRPRFRHVRRRFLGIERHLTSPVTG